jgi:5'-phosphate synthase pdxT subunit
VTHVPRIGVLSLQGDFAAHARVLAALGVASREVRRVRELDELDGLVLPGGESTTLLTLMAGEPWAGALAALVARGGALLATCAGTILLAREVLDPPQPSFGLLDAVVRRNAYGRQIDSFEAALAIAGSDEPLAVAFIRAPRIVAVGPDVTTLATWNGAPVLVRQGSILAATFHPEVTGDLRVHREFVRLAAAEAATAGSAR